MQNIVLATKSSLEDSHVLVHIDNKKVSWYINIKIAKTSIYSSNSRSIFSKIKELLKIIKIIIDYEYIKTRGLFNIPICNIIA